jgi:hypothetical protein
LKRSHQHSDHIRDRTTVLAATKYWNIAAEGYFDRDPGTGTPAGKTACKGFPQSGRLDAYNGISLWVETFATLESLSADGVALDVLGPAAEHGLHQELEKSDELRRTAEARTGNNVLHRRTNLFRCRSIVAALRNRH